MMTIWDRSLPKARFCDGLSRRNFLTIGGMALGGLSLPTLLRAEQQNGIRSSHKSVINIFLPGGPPHQDMWDLKPDAPAEIRGEFKPIATNVAGIQIGELFPKLAMLMDKLILIRTIVDAFGPHYAAQCLTGRVSNENPCFGAWVSHLEGPAHPSVPPNLSLVYPTQYPPWGEPATGGFLGSPHAPFGLVSHFEPGHKAKNEHELSPDAGRFVPCEISVERIRQRKGLLDTLERWRREVDTKRATQDHDDFHEQALSILTSPRLANALDISQEDPKIVERYPLGSHKYHANAAPRMTHNFLIARRLVEAGARVVSLNFSFWDWHANNFESSRSEFPLLDGAVAALVQDIYERGLDQDVTVIVWGEFGRSPKINKDAGREHWPRVNSALMFGGGMPTGQVVGATDRYAGEVIDRPVTFGDVHATLFHNLGLDPHTPVPDPAGRVYFPVDQKSQPIAELI